MRWLDYSKPSRERENKRHRSIVFETVSLVSGLRGFDVKSALGSCIFGGCRVVGYCRFIGGDVILIVEQDACNRGAFNHCRASWRSV